MLIKIFKFKMEFCDYKNNNLKNIFKYKLFFEKLVSLKKISNINIFDKKRELIIDLIPNSNFICGCLFSFKNEKTYCFYKKNKIETKTMKNGIDYNFFIINKETLFGVWSSYHNSASLSILNEIFKRQILEYTDNKKIKFSRCTIIQKDNDVFNNIQNRYSKILNLTYCTEDTNYNYFTPDSISYTKHELKFSKKNDFFTLVKSILSFTKSIETSNIRITGETIDNKNIETFNIDNILVPEKDFDYDIINNDINNLDIDNLNNFNFFNELKSIFENE